MKVGLDGFIISRFCINVGSVWLPFDAYSMLLHQFWEFVGPEGLAI